MKSMNLIKKTKFFLKKLNLKKTKKKKLEVTFVVFKTTKKFNRQQKQILDDEIEKKKHEMKKKQANPGEHLKPGLISQTYNPLNSRLKLN